MATNPANGKIGQIYYNSADKALMQYDGTQWKKVGVVYQQGSTTGAVITGLDDTGNVTTTNVVGLTLNGYEPVEGGYVSDKMALGAAIKALDTAVQNAVAGGGEVNQNAWSNISVKKQSTATTAVTGATADTTIQASTKTDTFAVASGNKWVDIGSDDKQINIGHSLSGVTAGTTGSDNSVPAITVDAAGHITKVEAKTITPAAIGAATTAQAEAAQNAAEAAQVSADAKVASVGAAANGGMAIESEVSLNNHKITDLLDPIADQDAATKAYVDGHSLLGDDGMIDSDLNMNEHGIVNAHRISTRPSSIIYWLDY